MAMVAPGDILTTITGRSTTPVPKFNLKTNRQCLNAIKKINQWLIDNAILEAKYRGNHFNLCWMERETAKNTPQASKDCMHMYLFGEPR